MKEIALIVHPQTGKGELEEISVPEIGGKCGKPAAYAQPGELKGLCIGLEAMDFKVGNGAVAQVLKQAHKELAIADSRVQNA